MMSSYSMFLFIHFGSSLFQMLNGFQVCVMSYSAACIEVSWHSNHQDFQWPLQSEFKKGPRLVYLGKIILPWSNNSFPTWHTYSTGDFSDIKVILRISVDKEGCHWSSCSSHWVTACMDYPKVKWNRCPGALKATVVHSYTAFDIQTKMSSCD